MASISTKCIYQLIKKHERLEGRMDFLLLLNLSIKFQQVLIFRDEGGNISMPFHTLLFLDDGIKQVTTSVYVYLRINSNKNA